MEKVICKQCGKQFLSFPSKKSKYCSKTCFNESKKFTMKATGSPSWLEIDHELLIELYCNQQRSMNWTGKQLGIDIRTVKRRLIYLGIKPRTYAEQYAIEGSSGRLVDYHKHEIVEGSFKRNRKNYLKIAKDNFPWVCSTCGKDKTNDSFDLVVHHKDGDNRNNEVDNLEVLCQGCHARKHMDEGGGLSRVGC